MVPIASRPTLDRALRRGAAELWVRVTVTDPAGNRGFRLARVRLGSGTLDWPLQRPALSSPFGVRWGRMHEGVDLAARPGARIRAADGGTVLMEGNDITRHPPHEIVEAGIALVPEDRGVFADLTVHENLVLGAHPRRARAREANWAALPG